MKWEHAILVRLFVASLCAAAVLHLTLTATGHGVISVVAGLCGFALGDHVATAFT